MVLITISTIGDGKDLVGNLHYQGHDKVILHVKNITLDLFDLSTRVAGEIL